MNPDLQPPTQGALAAAVQWLEGTLLGSVATTVAVIAVSCVGLLMLSGRVDVRRGAQVIFGCFILFGASSIAAGIMHVEAGTDAQTQIERPPLPTVFPTYPQRPVQQTHPTTPYDPYAGAALPSHR